VSAIFPVFLKRDLLKGCSEELIGLVALPEMGDGHWT